MQPRLLLGDRRKDLQIQRFTVNQGRYFAKSFVLNLTILCCYIIESRAYLDKAVQQNQQSYRQIMLRYWMCGRMFHKIAKNMNLPYVNYKRTITKAYVIV